MTCISLDLTIDAVLNDPVIAAAMRADHVDPRGFEALLRKTARRIDGAAVASTLGFGRASDMAGRVAAGGSCTC